MTDVRPQIVAQARWCVEHKELFNYREVRPFPLSTRAPIDNDCSATFTLCYYLAGAPDPNGPSFHYDGYGNTDSLAEHGQQLMASQVEPGDAVIYYEGDETVHVALIVALTPGDPGNPTTMSHGQQSEPAYVTVAEDGRAHRFFRFATNSRFPAPAPKPEPMPPAKGKPTAAELRAAKKVELSNASQAQQAIRNGHHTYYWSETKFVAQVAGDPKGVALYSDTNWKTKV